MGILGCDPITGADTVTTEEHRLIHEHRAFTLSRKEDNILVDETSDIMLVVPPGMRSHLRNYVPGVFGRRFADFFIYRSPDIDSDSGVAIPIYNHMDGSPRTPGLTAFHSPDVLDVGVELLYKAVPLTNPVSDRQPEWILASDTTYLLRVANDTGGSMTVAWDVFFYEVAF